MKTICRNCHFLAKEYREENTGRPLSFTLSASERTAVESDPEHAVKDHFSLKCQLGVWDEGVAKPTDSRDVTLNKAQRKNACFFFPHHPAMLFEAAKELQARQDANRQLKQSNSYTRVGLWIAAGALAADAIVTYFSQ
jgi:hypothetical protein